MGKAIEIVHKEEKAKESKIKSLFGDEEDYSDTYSDFKLPNIQDFSLIEKLKMEKEVLGYYVSGHPLNIYKNDIKILNAVPSSNISELSDKEDVRFIGIISNVKTFSTRKKEKLARLNVEDEEGIVTVIAYSNVYNETKELLKIDSIIYIEGYINKNDESTEIIASKITPIEEARSKIIKAIIFKLPFDKITFQTIEKIKAITEKFTGAIPFYIEFDKMDINGVDKVVIKPADNFRIEVSDKFFNQISKIKNLKMDILTKNKNNYFKKG